MSRCEYENTGSRFFGIFSQINQMGIDGIRSQDLYSDFYCKIYDFLLQAETYDIDIYAKAANQGEKMEILELACGAGRIMIELARQGHNITGIEISNDMIRLLEEKLVYQEAGIKERITVHQGDAAAFRLEKKYDMVILGACTICLFHTPEQRMALFRNAARHLVPDGLFIFDHQLIDTAELGKYEEKINLVPISTGEPKHFMLMGEKFFIDEGYSLVNFYNEIVEKNGNTTRYLGNTKKSILRGDIIEEETVRSGMTVVERIEIPLPEGTPSRGIKFIFAKAAD